MRCVANLYTLKITLRGVKPAVWRRVEIPGTTNLSVCNAIIIAAMGWSGYHLYEFQSGGRTFGEPHVEWEQDNLDASKHRLEDIATVGGWFTHKYDFGDGWVHRVEVEAARSVSGRPQPACIAGRNACPPEDVGGPDGYLRFLAAIRDPTYEDHDELLEWAGGSFDPTAFDLAETNASVARTSAPIDQF